MPTAKLILLLLPLRLRRSGLQLVSELYSTKWWRSARRSNDDEHGWLEQASQATMADGGPREDEAERVLQVVALWQTR